MKKVNWLLDNIEKWVCIVLFCIILVVVMISIIARSASISVAWTEELARYCFVWLIYIGSIKAVRERKHLKVDVLSVLVKRRGEYIFALINSISSIIFWGIMTYFTIFTLQKFVKIPQYSAALNLNMIVMYSAPLTGGILSLVHYIQVIFEDTRDYIAHRNNPAFPATDEGGQQ